MFGDPGSMEIYYRQLYSLYHNPSAKTVSTEIAAHRHNLAFARTSEKFKMIDDDQNISVLVISDCMGNDPKVRGTRLVVQSLCDWTTKRVPLTYMGSKAMPLTL